MKRRLSITAGTACCALGLAAAPCGAACNAPVHNPVRAHIGFSVSTLPTVRLYPRPDGSGAPVIWLDDRGLHVAGKLVCAWPGESFSKTAEPNRVLGFGSPAQCPAGVPVKSGFGDGGIGTAVLCMEVDRIAGGIAHIAYDNRTLYLDLGVIPRDLWRYEPPAEPASTR